MSGVDKKQEMLNHLTKPESVIQIADRFDMDWFDDRTESELREIVEYQIDHADQFGELATDEHLIGMFGPGIEFSTPVTNVDWLINAYEERFISSAIQDAVQSSASTIFADPRAALSGLIEKLGRLESEVADTRFTIRTSDYRYVLDAYFDQMEAGGDLPSFGFPEFDMELGGGMYRDRVYMTVARPKRYKSWQPIAIATANQKNDFTTAIFALEPSLEETFYRYACMVTKTPWSLFVENKLSSLDKERMHRVISALVDGKIPEVHIIKPPIGQRTARHLKSFAKNVGADVSCIDYLGFMETTNSRSQKEFERIPAIMQDLKISADEFPIYCLHHLSREVDANTMYDMRELGTRIGLSDAILKTSDTVFGIIATSSMLKSNIIQMGIVESRTNVPKTWEIAVELSRDSSFRVVGLKGDFDDQDDE